MDFKQEQKTIEIKESSIEMLKTELRIQKNAIDEQILRLEKKQIKNDLAETLLKIKDISNAIIPLQQSLNIIWKRTQQIEEEINKAIDKSS